MKRNKTTSDGGDEAIAHPNHETTGIAAVSTPVLTKPNSTIISIVDPEEHIRREALIEAKALRAKGRRGQPPMTDRLRSVMIHVDHLERQGVPFATARDSRMNKAVRERLNERMLSTKDDRKSRQGTIGADAVRDVLKEVAELRKTTKGS